MRMIDTDTFHIEEHTPTCDVSYDEGFEAGIEHVLEAMCDAPTIDAIPMEWLKAQNNSTEYFKTVQGQAVELILELWQKEQEAR